MKISNFFEKVSNTYSFGEYFIFHQNECIVLGDSENNDFMVISNIDDELDTRMYQQSVRLNYQTKDIVNLSNILKKKLQKPAISVFNISSNLIKEVKQSSKESTHIFITSIEDEFVIGSLDIRDEDKVFTIHELNGKRNCSFRKFISTDTFQRVINTDNYIVTVSYGDFVSFESIKNNHTIVLQEQQII